MDMVWLWVLVAGFGALIFGIQAVSGYFEKPVLGAVVPVAWLVLVGWLFVEGFLSFALRDVALPVMVLVFLGFVYQQGRDWGRKHHDGA